MEGGSLINSIYYYGPRSSQECYQKRLRGKHGRWVNVILVCSEVGLHVDNSPLVDAVSDCSSLDLLLYLLSLLKVENRSRDQQKSS